MPRKPKPVPISKLLDAAGLSRPELVKVLHDIIDETKDEKVKFYAARLALALHGETTNENSNQANLSINGPAMVIIGASPARIAALREAAEVPTRAELESSEAARVNTKLSLLKQGALPPLKRHSKATTGHPASRKTPFGANPKVAAPDSEGAIIDAEVLDAQDEESLPDQHGRNAGDNHQT